MKPRQAPVPSMRFGTVIHANVPHGRNGKHKAIVTLILKDLAQLKDDSAIKVPLSELADGKAKVRSALSRASKNAGRRIATSADAEFLYIWNIRS